MNAVEKDRAILKQALEKPDLSDENRESFEDMLEKLNAADKELSPKQRSWVKTILGDAAEPEYENLFSSGKVPLGNPVETIPALRRENLPLKPPGRK